MPDIPRVALVTGCGRPLGIGGATARVLAQRGFTIVVSDVELHGVPDAVTAPKPDHAHGLESVVDEIRSLGGECTAVLGDVRSEADSRRMVDDVITQHGRVDVLVNAAGAPQGPEFGDIESVSLEAWSTVLDINLTGTFLMCRSVIPHMRSNGWGRIINVSSLAGRTGYARQAAYSASKAGVLGLTRSLAVDVARDAITVNAVCPGWIRTSRTYSSARRVGEDVEKELSRRADRVPVGALGSGDDVANTIAFFTAEESAYITGQAHNVDGGLLMA